MRNVHVKHTIFALGTAAVFGMIGVACTASTQSAPNAPTATAPSATAPDQEATATSGYSKFGDPYFLFYDTEDNVFARRIRARAWVLAANHDPEGEARQERLAQANQAVEEAERAVASESDMCAARVDKAVRWAEGAKMGYERQYLRVVAEEGENSAEARLVDALVHLLRDEVVALQKLAETCPKRMYDDASEETK